MRSQDNGSARNPATLRVGFTSPLSVLRSRDRLNVSAAAPIEVSMDETEESPVSETSDEVEEATEQEAGQRDDSPAPSYDFGRSVWLASHRSGALRQTAAEIARTTAEMLSAWNANWQVTARDVRVGRADIDQPVDWAMLKFPLWRERGLLLVEHSVSTSILVNLLGDPLLQVGKLRPLSALEYSVVKLILDPLIDLTSSQLLMGSTAEIVHSEDPTPILAACESDLTFLVFEVDTQVTKGTIEIGLPSIALQSFAEFVDHRRQVGDRARSGTRTSAQALKVLGYVDLDAVVQFDPFPVGASVVANLQPGDVLRTGHPIHRPLTAVIGGKALYRVEAGQRGERLVVEVVEVPESNRLIP